MLNIKIVCDKCGAILFDSDNAGAYNFIKQGDSYYCNDCVHNTKVKVGRASWAEKSKWLEDAKNGLSVDTIAMKYSRNVDIVSNYLESVGFHCDVPTWFPKGYEYKPADVQNAPAHLEEVFQWVTIAHKFPSVTPAEIAEAFGRNVSIVTSNINALKPAFDTETQEAVRKKLNLGYSIEQTARKLGISTETVKYVSEYF